MEKEGVPQRSTFVTVVAWVFIILSAFWTLIGSIQNVLLWTVLRVANVNGVDMSVALQEARAESLEIPAIVVALMPYLPYLLLVFLLIALIALASSIGLLRRWNPARLCFIALMIFSAVWKAAGLTLQFSLIPSLRQQWADRLGTVPLNPQFFNGIMVVDVLFSVASVVLFLWIAKRLLSPEIAAEFRR